MYLPHHCLNILLSVKPVIWTSRICGPVVIGFISWQAIDKVSHIVTLIEDYIDWTVVEVQPLYRHTGIPSTYGQPHIPVSKKLGSVILGCSIATPLAAIAYADFLHN
jgi:hypothetical protein